MRGTGGWQGEVRAGVRASCIGVGVRPGADVIHSAADAAGLRLIGVAVAPATIALARGGGSGVAGGGAGRGVSRARGAGPSVGGGRPEEAVAQHG